MLIARDIVGHRDDYHLGPITISVEQKVRYTPLAGGEADPGQATLAMASAEGILRNGHGLC